VLSDVVGPELQQRAGYPSPIQERHSTEAAMTALTIDVITDNLDELGGKSKGRDEYPV